MGQAKRRKQALGDAYGTPEGSNKRGLPAIMEVPPLIKVVFDFDLEDYPIKTGSIPLSEFVDSGEVRDHIVHEMQFMVDGLALDDDEDNSLALEYFSYCTVTEVIGMGKRLAGLVSDLEGWPAIEAMEDIVSALNMLPTTCYWEPFLAWAETSEWLPGNGIDVLEDWVRFFYFETGRELDLIELDAELDRLTKACQQKPAP